MVLAAINKLPDRQRETVMLRYYEDMTVADTASAMDVSPGAVKSHTARAIAKLEGVLGEITYPAD